MPRTSAQRAQRKLRRLGGFGIAATGVWLCLMGMGISQPPKDQTRLAGEGASSCKLKQKKPLFVGFPEGMHLDRFEASTRAAHDILHDLKHWACDDGGNASVAVPSLQLAFARSEPLRLDLVQFDDPTMVRAHVLLGEEHDISERPRWRLDLSEQDADWTVTQTRLATADDIAEAHASQRSK